MKPPPSTLEEYVRGREIPREPGVPQLSTEDLAKVERAVFISRPAIPSDLLFVFGSSEGRWELVASLFERGVAPLILVTGRAGEDFYATGKPQSHRIRDALVALGVPEQAILTEDESDNTLENVRHGKALLVRQNKCITSIVFVCKSHHAGRAWRTLTLAFPQVTLSCSTYDATYSGITVSRQGWAMHEVSRGRVYGEFKRIQVYSERGDIAKHALTHADGLTLPIWTPPIVEETDR